MKGVNSKGFVNDLREVGIPEGTIMKSIVELKLQHGVWKYHRGYTFISSLEKAETKKTTKKEQLHYNLNKVEFEEKTDDW